MNKLQIRADVAKNRLYLSLHGYFDDDEIIEAADMTIAAAKKLQPGFDCINDISNFKATSPEGMKEMRRAQQFVHEYGMRRVIRVVGTAMLGALQLEQGASQVGYAANEAATAEEAERILDIPPAE